jgi:hypothetical protein
MIKRKLDTGTLFRQNLRARPVRTVYPGAGIYFTMREGE